MDLLTVHKLKEALPLPGCPICRIGDDDARYYLSVILHEYVNDVHTRRKLAASWGFCRYHAWCFLSLEWVRYHDGMSTANLTEWQVGRLRELLRESREVPARVRRLGRLQKSGRDLQSVLRSRLDPTAECPACHSRRQSEEYALRVLLEDLGAGGELTLLLRDSPGVCLAHLRAALEARDRESGVHVLLEIQEAKLDALYQELEEYLRKHDYRFSHEPYGSELDAFVRATALLAGSWSDLTGRAAPDTWHERQAELAVGGRAVTCSLCRKARSRRGTWVSLREVDVAACAKCLERWDATGRQCVACGKPVGLDEVGYLPAQRDLGHLQCGGLSLERQP